MNPEQNEIRLGPTDTAAPDGIIPAQPKLPTGPRNCWAVFWMCVVLVVMTLAVFGQTVRHEFINYDDSSYVYENTVVKAGLTMKGIAAAFHINRFDYWIPLTTLSHMLDCQLYGLKAGGHHLTNLILHTAAVIFLFLALRRMTGALWRPAFVAALFAIHPLHVESVTWLAERKDVLSGLFFMLALWAYGKQRLSTPHSSLCTQNWLVLVFFVLGLMAKPMLVTLPFVLLLLDYWPLNRISFPHSPLSTLHSSLLQKWPLFLLVPAACVLTVFAQGHTPHAIQSLESSPISSRIDNALVSYVTYIGQMFYPSNLVVFYSRPTNGYPLWESIGAFLLLAGISLVAYILRQKHPYLIVGWLWYLGMLAPVIGFIQVGFQAHADRYTYLPQIGLYMMVAWGVTELAAHLRCHRVVLGAVAAMVIGVLAICSFLQAAYWKDSESLWTHTLVCAPDNLVARNNLGSVLMNEGRLDEAMAHFQKALEIHPRFAQAENNLGNILSKKGKLDEAMAHYQKALEIQPDLAEAHNNLGSSFLHKRDVDDAMAHFKKAVESNPGYAIARYNLARTLLIKGELDKAATEYKKGMEIQPEFVANFPAVQKDISRIAWTMATSPDSSIRNGAKAIDIAEQTDRLSHGTNAMVISALAAGYAEAGRFPDAVTTAKRALQQAGDQNKPALTAALQEQLNSYQKGSPWRETAQP